MKIRSLIKRIQNRYFHRNSFCSRKHIKIEWGHVGIKRCAFTAERSSTNNDVIFRGSNTILYNSTISIKGTNNKVVIGSNCSIHHLTLKIEGDDCQVFIGDGASIPSMEAEVGGRSNILSMGNDFHIAGPACIFAIEAPIKIGDDFLGGRNLVIRSSDRHKIYNKDGERLNENSGVIIDNHVWATMNVTILKGVSVARGTIIATGSVVTKPVHEPNTIVGGMPAKTIKQGVFWQE